MKVFRHLIVVLFPYYIVGICTCHKHLFLNDAQGLASQIHNIESRFKTLCEEIDDLKLKNNRLSNEITALKNVDIGLDSRLSDTNRILHTSHHFAGTTYVRWGRKDCPLLNGTKLVYSGFAGGGSFGETGSGTNYLCLPHNPDCAPSDFPTALENRDLNARIWGAEFQFSYGNIKVNDDVPCAVCMDITTTSSIMIPAKNYCPSQWRKQYSGYLAANYYNHPAASEYACVDESPQYFAGRRSNLDGKLFYPVVTVCGSLPCPPYEESKYLKCVVCSY